MKRAASEVSLARVGGYPIVELINAGGMGTVYKGLDPVTEKTVAVKVIPEEVTADPVLRMRFAQECQVARSLKHPHCVQVLDFGLDGSTPFMVMEYVDGESVGQRLQREGRLPEAEAVRLITQAGQALHHAHRSRLVHRDVKPDNILLTADGEAKLADLGLAKSLESDYQLTRTQTALGTPNFMAPEQFEDAKRADARSDLYSLAATLYMMVTGELPFRSRSVRAVAAIYKKKLANEIVPPRQLVPELSASLEKEILRALDADRDRRHGSVQEFLDGLAPEPPPLPGPGQPAADTPAPTADKDVRREKRYPARRKTSCQPLQRLPDESWAGQVVNLSRNGICLKLGRRFERGALLRVVLEGEQTKRRSVVARVVWVKPDTHKTWRLGCRFDQPLSDFEVHELR
jgi:eukaryotic-like serine/threonine-protein kinase